VAGRNQSNGGKRREREKRKEKGKDWWGGKSSWPRPSRKVNQKRTKKTGVEDLRSGSEIKLNALETSVESKKSLNGKNNVELEAEEGEMFL
jgi:hypothetical protein